VELPREHCNQRRDRYTSPVDTPHPYNSRLQPQPWQQHPLTQLVVAIAGVAPLYALSILSSVQSMITGESPKLELWSSIFTVVLFVGVFGSWILVLQHYVCGESLRHLQLSPGKLSQDITSGVALALLLLAAVALLGTLAGIVGVEEIPQANREIAQALAGNKLLFAVWVGPVVWLQAALIEELNRAFMLAKLWRVWTSPAGRALTVIGSALLFGLGHAYQGPQGILGTAVIGLVLGLHYMRRGRLLPLIIAHGIYDTVILSALVLLAANGVL
jgi:membrane protease YdiL (CAAX protease family)